MRARTLLGISIASLQLGCYSGQHHDPPGPRPDGDADGDGVPDAIGPDPDLYDGWVNPPEGDHDADGLADDVDVDDDNDRVLDDRPEQALVDAVKPLALAQCEAAAACCPAGWSAEALDACALQSTGDLVVALAQSWSDGFVRVEPSGFAACAARQALDCGSLMPRSALAACDGYLVGQQAEREACNRSVDCGPGLGCSVEAEAEVGERESQVVDEPGRYYLRFWEASLGGLSDATCLPLLSAGEPCRDVGQLCGPALACDERVEPAACLEVAAPGDACRIFGGANRSDTCRWGAFCDDASGDAVCVPARAASEPCDEDRQCASQGCDLRAGVCVGDAPITDTCAE